MLYKSFLPVTAKRVTDYIQEDSEQIPVTRGSVAGGDFGHGYTVAVLLDDGHGIYRSTHYAIVFSDNYIQNPPKGMLISQLDCHEILGVLNPEVLTEVLFYQVMQNLLEKNDYQ